VREPALGGGTAHTAVSSGHGRRVRRTITVIDAPAWVAFPGARQVAQIRRTVTKGRRQTVEVVYVITSADHHAAPPATLAAWVQGHWSIEVRHEVALELSEITGNGGRECSTVSSERVLSLDLRVSLTM